jgi:hypothetical protein
MNRTSTPLQQSPVTLVLVPTTKLVSSKYTRTLQRSHKNSQITQTIIGSLSRLRLFCLVRSSTPWPVSSSLARDAEVRSISTEPSITNARWILT